MPKSVKRKAPRRWAVIAGILAIIMMLVPVAVTIFTDVAWFNSMNFGRVYVIELITRSALFVGVGLLAGAAVWAAAWVAIQHRPLVPEDADPRSPLEAYRQVIVRSTRPVLVGLPLAVGVLGGLAAQSEWRMMLMFLHRENFGEADPQFHHDYGFYAFSVPFWSRVISLVLTLAVVAFVVNLVMNWLLGGIRTADPQSGKRATVMSQARVQLASIAGVFMVAKAGDYWFERYRLLSKDHPTFTGGSYTDINAVLPAKIVLLVVSIVVAAAFFAAIFLRDLRVPALAAVLMVASAGVIGVAWPLVVEQFNVSPNRAAKERDYIARNITSTRYNYGLTKDHVSYERNWGAGGMSKSDKNESVANDSATISNIRLLDPETISATFTQQQQLKNFYGFPRDLSIDRYEHNGQMQDYVVAARELDPKSLSGNQKDWINKHTVYTHGNGFIAAPANKVDEVARDVGSSRGGYPIYTVADLQSKDRTQSDDPDTLKIKVDQPRIYFGPIVADTDHDYAVVGGDGSGKPREYDTDGSNYTYTGTGGVGIGNPLSRAMYSLKYQSMNLLLSDAVGKDSKIVYDRDPRDRVHKVAPWLTTDSQTYPAVINGRIKWIVDGYTSVNNLPYSEHMQISGATEDSLNPQGTKQNTVGNSVSYIRNSVKATVDAYDGSVDLYAFDEHDPILKSWRRSFPGTVKPKSAISDELMKHLRYPEDLFKIQRELVTRYHVSDPGVFFTNDSFWSVPLDPTASEQGLRDKNQPPYYVVASDPKTGDPSFQLITPLRGLKREFLSAHMSVSSDPQTYGKITVRVLPTDTQTQGPKQAQDTMMSSDQISRERTLLEGSSTLINGNLLTLPVGDGGIVYVEPVYSKRKQQESAFPKLLRVLVFYNGQVGYAPTIGEALSQVGIDPKETTTTKEADGAKKDDSEHKGGGPSSGSDSDGKDQSGGAGSGVPSGGDVSSLDQAVQKVRDAKNSGSFEEYGKALDELQKALEKYQNDGGVRGAGQSMGAQ
ncbi:UPF0182 family protein [Corynebacterium kroppenstedtii]|uniref:UPF0182 family protein n=1 Tax=Corynebacterium sp. PCR 32 TaxID=3351342 RepID=UPI00309DBF6B